MSVDYDHIRAISRYWSAFYEKIDKLIAPDIFEKVWKATGSSLEASKAHTRARTEAIRQHIGATHTWIPGKEHKFRTHDNWGSSPIGCAVCGLCGSIYDEDGKGGFVELAPGKAPSRDSHANFINRTCQEVLAARNRARKKKKGGFCEQCRTYECMMKDT